MSVSIRIVSGRLCPAPSARLPPRQRLATVPPALRAAPLQLTPHRPSYTSKPVKYQRVGLYDRTRCEAGAPADGEVSEHRLVPKLTGEELEVAIQERTRPLVIDFYATWCGPCVLMAKELAKVAEELGEDKVRVVKVDTEENPLLSNQLQIQGLPTLVFVSTDTSKPALRTEGLLPAATIKEIIEKEL